MTDSKDPAKESKVAKTPAAKAKRHGHSNGPTPATLDYVFGKPPPKELVEERVRHFRVAYSQALWAEVKNYVENKEAGISVQDLTRMMKVVQDYRNNPDPSERNLQSFTQALQAAGDGLLQLAANEGYPDNKLIDSPKLRESSEALYRASLLKKAAKIISARNSEHNTGIGGGYLSSSDVPSQPAYTERVKNSPYAGEFITALVNANLADIWKDVARIEKEGRDGAMHLLGANYSVAEAFFSAKKRGEEKKYVEGYVNNARAFYTMGMDGSHYVLSDDLKRVALETLCQNDPSLSTLALYEPILGMTRNEKGSGDYVAPGSPALWMPLPSHLRFIDSKAPPQARR
jgi:hypothetical protein